MLEVDVLKYPIFCDKFLDLVYRRLCVCKCLFYSHLDPIDVLDILMVEMNCHIHSIDLNQLYHQFEMCLK